MTVLVTGASGFVGRGVVPALAARGWPLRLALRSPAAGPSATGVGIVAMPDLETDVDWVSLVAGTTHVVHLAGIAHAMGGIAEARYDVANRRATEALAQACARAGAHLVFVSSVRAQSGPVADGILTEDGTPRPTDAYGRSKLAAEMAVRAAGAGFTILRPVLVHGPGVGGNMAALMRLAASPWPLPFGAFRNLRSLCARDTLVAAIAWALDAPAARGDTYLVADPEPLSLAELIAEMRAGLGRTPGLVPVPPAIVTAGLRLAGSGEMAARLAGSLVVSTRKLEAAGFRWPGEARAAIRAMMAAGRVAGPAKSR